MLTLTLSLASARVPIVHDTRTTSGVTSTAHQAASIGATASGVAILLAVAIAGLLQLALLVAEMLAKAVIALFRLLAVPLLILLLLYLLFLAGHAKSQTTSHPTQAATSQSLTWQDISRAGRVVCYIAGCSGARVQVGTTPAARERRAALRIAGHIAHAGPAQYAGHSA
jgi:hypothetical protein